MATELSEAFWISFIGVASALVGLSIRYTLRSKCDNVKCCGLVEIHRNTEQETDLEQGANTPPHPQNIYRQDTEDNIRL